MNMGESRYYLLLYEVVNDYVERRAPLRAEHLSLAQEAYDRGDLVAAGAFADPVDGAALLFRTEDPNLPATFAERDPYVRAGLVVAWRVRQWKVVVGGV